MDIPINNHINDVENYLLEDPKRVLIVGKHNPYFWIVEDDDLEISALIVVRYMLKMNYTNIGKLYLTKYSSNEDQPPPRYVVNYTLTYKHN